ncbi:MAG: DUF192 domain-containing protein [Spirochaetaceae bacterium]|jgi:uncharacterized membrane protein (UPF0127 family)|nr:DUF192 domain-containing protein [Spirochaetaceae bacterium]
MIFKYNKRGECPSAPASPDLRTLQIHSSPLPFPAGRHACTPVVALFFMLFFLYSACVPAEETAQKKLPVKEFEITTQNGKKLTVKTELARSNEERQRGLMFRKQLADGEAMLFIFDQDKILSFWMKDTFIPLSIAYISKDGTIAEIHDMAAFDQSAVQSSRSLRYALEVPQGWFSREGITTGDTIHIVLDPL